MATYNAALQTASNAKYIPMSIILPPSCMCMHRLDTKPIRVVNTRNEDKIKSPMFIILSPIICCCNILKIHPYPMWYQGTPDSQLQEP